MDDPHKLRQFIRDQIFDGFDFFSIIEKLHLTFCGIEIPTPDDTLKLWISKVEENDFHDIPEELHLAFKLTREELQRAERAIYARKCSSIRAYGGCVIQLSPRYAIEMVIMSCRPLKDLYLIDLFHGGKKKLEFDDIPQGFSCYFRLHHFNPDHFLLRNYDREADPVYLIRVDFQHLKCFVADTFLKAGGFKSCIFDVNDPTKFVTCSYYSSFNRAEKDGYFLRKGRFLKGTGKNDYYLRKGRSLNGRIVLERDTLPVDAKLNGPREEKYEHNLKLHIGRLEGNDLYTFEKERDRIYYVKLTVHAKQVEFTRLFKIDTGNETDIDSYFFYRWTFHKNAWYSIKHTENEDDQNFFKLDLNERKITEFGLELEKYVYSIQDIAMDGDILQICGFNRSTKQLFYWRKTLTTPDKLFNLAMIALSKEIMFISENDYKLLFKTLPPALKPFGGISLSEEEDSSGPPKRKVRKLK